MRRPGLRTRLLAGLAFLTLAAIGSAGAVALWAAESLALENERHFGATAARAVAYAHVPGEALSREAARLAPLVRRVGAEIGAEELTVVDGSGTVVASTDGILVGTRVRDPAVVLALRSREPSTATSPRGPVFAEPILDGDRTAGAVRLVLRSAASEGLARARATIVALTVADAAFLIVAGALLLGGSVVRPIERLCDLARRVAAGEFGHTVPVEGGGEIVDLTLALNEMSRALRDHVRRLGEAREQLIRSEKLASIGRLAAGVAHEVGNPLAAIMGFSEILRDPNLPPEERADLAERITRETARIHQIVRELLDYARPVRDAVEAVRVDESVESALALAVHHKRWRDLEVERDLPADLPPVAAGSSRLTQVLVNLLLNAADAMDGRGRVRIAARADGGAVEIRVSDTGPGVPPDVRAGIFEPFMTTKQPGEGTGLGLAICHTIVGSYGGSIALADEPGWGATFVVRLPAS